MHGGTCNPVKLKPLVAIVLYLCSTCSIFSVACEGLLKVGRVSDLVPEYCKVSDNSTAISSMVHVGTSVAAKARPHDHGTAQVVKNESNVGLLPASASHPDCSMDPEEPAETLGHVIER